MGKKSKRTAKNGGKQTQKSEPKAELPKEDIELDAANSSSQVSFEVPIQPPSDSVKPTKSIEVDLTQETDEVEERKSEEQPLQEKETDLAKLVEERLKWQSLW